jgi:hypothetical protein
MAFEQLAHSVMQFFTTGISVRGPGPLPTLVPSVMANDPGANLALNGQQDDAWRRSSA